MEEFVMYALLVMFGLALLANALGRALGPRDRSIHDHEPLYVIERRPTPRGLGCQPFAIGFICGVLLLALIVAL